MINKKIAFIRVDANVKIGTGHLIRCLNLAKALRDENYKCVFLIKESSNIAIQLIQENSFSEILVPCGLTENNEIEFYLNVLNECDAFNVFICDGDDKIFYSDIFQEKISKQADVFLHITFNNAANFKANILHNQNPLALSQKYSVADYTNTLFGPKYILMDPKFVQLKQKTENVLSKTIDNILFTFGGSDPQDLIRRLINEIRFWSFNGHLIIVLGKLYAHRPELEKLLENVNFEYTIYQNTPILHELISKSDLIVSSGGTTVWEIACLGKPNAVISASERERITCQYLRTEACIDYWGHYSEDIPVLEKLKGIIDDFDKRKEISIRAGILIDGNGIARVVEEILKKEEESNN